MNARILFSALALAAAAVSQTPGQGDPGLFTELGAIGVSQSASPEGVRRTRLVGLDLDRLRQTLPNEFGGTASTDTIAITLFDGQRIVAARERIDATGTGYVWVGRIQDGPAGRVMLAVTGGVLAGSLTTDDAVYSVRLVGDGVYAIQDIDQGSLPPEAPPLVPPVAPDVASPNAVADDGSIIDVLVLYTRNAEGAGGTAAVQAAVDLAIADANEAYAASNVIHRLRLVNKRLTLYVESGNMSLDLERLAGKTDGYLDEIHDLRDLYKADIVHLISYSPIADFCGIGFLMTSVSTAFEPWAFGVTRLSCVAGYSFAHELGHNMGVHHDVYASGSATGAFAYSRGYVNQAAFSSPDPAKRWRDIMAYDNQCQASGFSCTRLRRFSNPGILINGDPTGNVASADAASTLNATRAVVANFRSSSGLDPLLTIDDVTLTEGNAGTKQATFTVSLSQAASSTVTVRYSTADLSAASGTDFVGASGTIVFSAGQTSRPVVVTILGDTAAEMGEGFAVDLSGAVGAVIDDSRGIGTIVNDDLTELPAAGMLIRASHVAEVRALVNQIRAFLGIPSFGFADSPLVAQFTSLRASHITELRSALNAAYQQLGLGEPEYTDATLVPGVTPARAVHLTEIRDAASVFGSVALPPVTTDTVTFSGVTVDEAPLTTYSEAGYVVHADTHHWVTRTSGAIEFSACVTTVAQVSVTAGGLPFVFRRADFYSSTTSIPYVITGRMNGATVFQEAATHPITFGNYVTIEHKPHLFVDSVSIQLTNVPMGCFNPMAIDNLVLSR